MNGVALNWIIQVDQQSVINFKESFIVLSGLFKFKTV
jgi:hypothetical protein